MGLFKDDDAEKNRWKWDKAWKQRIEILLTRIEANMRPAGRFSWAVARPTPKGDTMPLTVGCTNEEKIHIAVQPLTSTGKPSALDGSIGVSVISGDSTYVIDGDGKGFYLVSADTPGDTTFLVEGDADLGAGVVTIQDTVTLQVVGALAANLGLMAGPPEPK